MDRLGSVDNLRCLHVSGAIGYRVYTGSDPALVNYVQELLGDRSRLDVIRERVPFGSLD